jgi:DNA-binding GntR family transcriptional regulator
MLIAVNKQERTYAILRDRIHSGRFASLERLNIDALARHFGRRRDSDSSSAGPIVPAR